MNNLGDAYLIDDSIYILTYIRESFDGHSSSPIRSTYWLTPLQWLSKNELSTIEDLDNHSLKVNDLLDFNILKKSNSVYPRSDVASLQKN